MILFKLRVTTCVTSCRRPKSYSPLAESTKVGRAIDARLQTATSSGAVYSIISVHKLELRIVPRFFWLLFLLHASLYSVYGVPVSVWASRIAYHSFWALMVVRPLPSFSYFS